VTFKSLRCWLSGGHSKSLPVVKDGKYCLTCLHGCGWTTPGIPMAGYVPPAPKVTVGPRNLRMVRGTRLVA